MSGELFFGYAAMVLLVLAASLATGTIVQNARRRTHDLRAADRALQSHYDALATVLDCDDVSERLKGTVYSFHHAVIARESALEIAAKIVGTGPSEEDETENDFEREYQALRTSNSRAFDALNTTIHTGIITLVLRWPETAKLFRKVSVEVAVSENERSITRALIEKGKRYNGNGNGDGPSVGGTLQVA